MLKKLFACAFMIGSLGLGSAMAQDLGPFPVDRVRETPEDDLITNARLTTTSFGFLKLTNNARSAGMGDAYSARSSPLPQPRSRTVAPVGISCSISRSCHSNTFLPVFIKLADGAATRSGSWGRRSERRRSP